MVGQLLTEVFEGNIDAVVIELLVLVLELIAATCPAMEELGDRPDWRIGRSIHPCRRSEIDETVQVVVDDIVIQLADLYSSTGSLRIRSISACEPNAGMCS